MSEEGAQEVFLRTIETGDPDRFIGASVICGVR
jgi:hypothetical protein